MDDRTLRFIEEIKEKRKGTFPLDVVIKGCVLPKAFLELEEHFNNLEVLDSDIWICSFPRTGTTWTCEMVWLIENNLDYETAKKTPLNYSRVDFIDIPFLFKNRKPSDKQTTSSRMVKTHLPWTFLPKAIRENSKKPKIIYITRNPLDVCVSNYHLSLNWGEIPYHQTFEEYCQNFISGKVRYSPFWDHVKSYWQHRNEPNVLFLQYEDLKADLGGNLRKVAKFLNKKLTDADIATLQEHLSFDAMKQNSAINQERRLKIFEDSGLKMSPFLRNGQVGDYQSRMAPETVKQFHKWMLENLEGTGLHMCTNTLP